MTATTYIYNVNGTDFEDTVAFGDAWKKAVALATETHSVITRTVIKDETDIRNEFFANGGAFLNERFYSKEKIKVF